MTVISVIVGSVRQERFAEKTAHWILDHLKKREGIDARLLDLADYPLPFFDAPSPPAMPGRPAYEHEVVKRWTRTPPGAGPRIRGFRRGNSAGRPRASWIHYAAVSERRGRARRLEE